MKKQIIIICLVFIGITACGKKAGHEKTNPDTPIVEHNSLYPPSEINTQFDIPDPIQTTVKWKECTITLEGYFMLDEDTGTVYEHDTLTIYAELGTYTDSFSISVSNEKLTDIKIEEQYETSVTIQNEGPHCDLINWKHYTSPWRSIKKGASGNFITEAYSKKEREKFPSLKTGELKNAVKKHCKEDRWVNLIQENQTTNEFCMVTISRLFLKITAKNNETGTMINRIIIIEVPMGC